MNILKHLDKENLHHAYLIEGERIQIISQIIKFCEDLDIKISGNPDFINIQLDSLKIEDARNLKSYTAQKSFSSAKKIFIISANNFLLEAQNSLLKIFEESIENTHFFLIVPDINALLKTFVSRFYLISQKTVFGEVGEELQEAEKFITMSLKNRIDFIKELLITPEEEDEEGNEIVTLSSSRSRALKFLNALEFALHKKFLNPIGKTYGVTSLIFFEHIFKVREFLRMPGSSAKTLMESVALVIPSF